jgi:nitric oxide reductase large subunit
MRFWHEADVRGLQKLNDEELEKFLFEFQTTSVKLGGALNGVASGHGCGDAAFTVACLKRALDHLHKTQAALEAVAPKELLPRQTIAEARQELFELRQEVLKLMDDFRRESNL